MFLFSTPPAREAAPANPVVDAIRQGAERTGTGFDYLLATAQRESSLDPKARARSSSATGLFQFIEQTWLRLVKSEGPKHGLTQYSDAISAKGDGTLSVDNPKLRQQILELRQDPAVASVMAGTFTQRNRDMLAAELGREPTNGDLYAAHFLGARGAVDLIRTAQRTPRRAAASDFPDAAAANRTIFFDARGRARGAGEVYAILAASHGAAVGGATAAPAFAPDKPLAPARDDGPALHGLFRTDGRRGPISEEVAQLWKSSNAADSARNDAGKRYFPRRALSPNDQEPVTTGALLESSVLEPAIPAAAKAPLPPRRPDIASPIPEARNAPGRRGRPLDLSAFMSWRRRA